MVPCNSLLINEAVSEIRVEFAFRLGTRHMQIILDRPSIGAYILGTMYLRTSTRKNKDGTVATYLQIAENTWNAKKGQPDRRIICTLGRADGKAKERLIQLAASIRRYGSFEMIAELEPGWRFINSWEHGHLYVISRLWERLGIKAVLDKALREEDRSVPLERSLFLMVANRCIAPAPKLFCYERWLKEDIYFPEGEGIGLHHLYRSMDFLADHKDEIEEELFWQLANLLNLDVDLVFYDTTSLHFEIDEEDEGEDALRMRGYPKNGRDDVPQIVVGLAVTRDGIPVKSWVWPGNTPDVKTVERVKEDLKGWRLNRCVYVGDAGMFSEENLHTLAKGGSSYVVASPCTKGGEVVTEVLSRPGRFRTVRENLQVKEVWVGEGERRRRYVVCFNPQEAERQRKHREEVIAELEAELATLDGHPKRACELLASRRYGRYLRRLKDGKLKLSKAGIEEAAKRDGLWVLRTNDESLTTQDIALAYKQLARVEESWKMMKSGLKIRPILHRTPKRIRAHVYLCVLALALERVVENACNASWREIRQDLRQIKVGQMLTPNGSLYQVSPLNCTSRNILTQLKITPPPEILAVQKRDEES